MDEYVFGANILENLTTGMYQDSKVSYREYIQNACDQIDKAVEMGILSSIQEGKIEIWLDDKTRTISVEDNATGIPQADFEKTLANIADSSKKLGTDKGFRGIGRLCGLAYCSELVFTSTAPGESVISEMRCDARKMRELLNRNVNGEKFTASEVLKEIYSFDYKTDTTIKDEHWFKVELIGINKENTDLLDFAQVKKYLSFTAPVPYKNTFSFQTEIYKHAEEIGYVIDEYTIKLNGEDVFKKYSTHFKTSKGDDEIFGVEFKDFYDEKGNLIMWLWFGLSQFKAIISKDCDMRGLRLRKANIQIGNEDALQKLFKEDRGQHYFVGEVFAVSKGLIPNSQRDYFNENSTRVWFETETKRYFRDALTKVYYDCSAANSSFKKMDDFQKKVEEHNRKTENNDYIDAEHITQAENKLKDAEAEAQKAKEKIDKLKTNSSSTESGSVLTRVIERIEKEREKENKPQAPPQISVPPSSTPQPASKAPKRTDKLSRCSKQERKLIGRIFSIIMKSTDEKTAESIIKNIEEEFK